MKHCLQDAVGTRLWYESHTWSVAAAGRRGLLLARQPVSGAIDFVLLPVRRGELRRALMRGRACFISPPPDKSSPPVTTRGPPEPDGPAWSTSIPATVAA